MTHGRCGKQPPIVPVLLRHAQLHRTFRSFSHWSAARLLAGGCLGELAGRTADDGCCELKIWAHRAAWLALRRASRGSWQRTVGHPLGAAAAVVKIVKFHMGNTLIACLSCDSGVHHCEQRTLQF